MSDSSNAIKLGPATAAPEIATVTSATQPYCICTHCNHLLTFNHHVAAEQGATEAGFHVQSQQSSRWSPAPAQLLYLEELYTQGMRTPTAEQIEQIASQLRRFGKIEGKNVFYWFQNHKARERQKRRRLEMDTAASSSTGEKQLYVVGSTEKQLEAAGLRATSYHIKETKKWASASNCSGLPEESDSLDKVERVANGWTQFEEREIRVLGRDKAERQAKCQHIEHTTLIARDLASQNYTLQYVLNRGSFTCYGEENADAKTLELFPPKRDDQHEISLPERGSKFCTNASMDTKITSKKKFFEFLPLKN